MFTVYASACIHGATNITTFNRAIFDGEVALDVPVDMNLQCGVSSHRVAILGERLPVDQNATVDVGDGVDPLWIMICLAIDLNFVS